MFKITKLFVLDFISAFLSLVFVVFFILLFIDSFKYNKLFNYSFLILILIHSIKIFINVKERKFLNILLSFLVIGISFFMFFKVNQFIV